MNQPLIEQRPEGDYFTGDLAAAQQIMTDEYGDHITFVEHREHGTVSVVEHRGGTPDSPNQWGTALTLDEAWRYLIGADFGPVDSEYDEPGLRELLAKTEVRA